jgi:hypothetical protein
LIRKRKKNFRNEIVALKSVFICLTALSTQNIPAGQTEKQANTPTWKALKGTMNHHDKALW